MKKTLSVVMVICMINCFAISAGAQDKSAAPSPEKSAAGKAEGKNDAGTKPKKISDEARAVQNLATAGRLAEYGRKSDNPAALLVAAQMMKNTPTKDEALTKKNKGTKVAETGKKAGEIDTPDKLLADAKAMAEKQNNDSLLTLIDKESKLAAQRSTVPGPIRHIDTVQPDDTDIYAITFEGNELAAVAVVGDGDCDLDLYVYDENENLIASDTGESDRCSAQWIPRETERFYIHIKNLGIAPANYMMVSN